MAANVSPGDDVMVGAPVSLAWWMLLLPLTFFVVRCGFAAYTELFADEAYYWTWSRTLSGGYFDHPPLTAWLISASTAIFGTQELTVRLPAILLGAGSIVVASELVRQLRANARTILTLQLVLIAFPMLHVQAMVITPDCPAMFFVLLMLLAAVRCLCDGASFPWFIALGITSGLAMLSKYTAVLPVAAAFTFAMIVRPRHWAGLFLAGVIACLVLLPMLAWNASHDWASIRFQLGHGTNRDQRGPLLNLGDYLGGQLLVASPVLAPLLIYGAIRALRKSQPAAVRLIAVASLVPLSFFAATSLLHKVEANWPSQVWLPLVVLLCVTLPGFSAPIQRWGKAGVIVAAVITFGLHLPPALLSRIDGPHTKTGGWKALAELVHDQTSGLPIYCTRYQDAALFAVYTAGQPVVPLLRTGGRLSQYDFIPMAPLPAKFVLLSSGPFPIGPFTAHHGTTELNFEIVTTGRVGLDLDGLQRRERFFAVCLSRDATASPR